MRNIVRAQTDVQLAYMTWAVIQTCIIPLRAMSTTGSTSAAFAYSFQNFLGKLSIDQFIFGSRRKPNSTGNSPLLFSAQIFRAQYAPRYTVPFITCIVFIVASMVPVCTMWWCCRDLERDTRIIAAERRRAGKNGEVATVDVHDIRKN